MVHFVAHLLHDRDRAIDLVQEAFYLACRAHDQVDPRRPLVPWLFQIARNLAYKEHNRRKRQPEVSIDDTEEPSATPRPASGLPSPRATTADREVMDRIQDVVDRIKPKYRDVLILRLIEGLPSKEVSQFLGLPVATVNTRTHRALALLRRGAKRKGIRESELFS